MSTTLESPHDAPRHAPSTSPPRRKVTAIRAADASAKASFWRSGAAKSLRAGGLEPDAAWKKYFAQRAPRASVSQLCDCGTTPLGWALNADSLPAACRQLYDFADQLAADANYGRFRKGKPRKQVSAALGDWLAYARKAVPDRALAASSLAAAIILDAVGDVVEAELGWQVIDVLHRLSVDALNAQADAESPPETFLAVQMLGCELPLTLSHLFAEMAPLHDLRDPACERLAESIDETISDEGFPVGAWIGVMRPLVACWTRCGCIIRTAEKGAWPKPTQRQYQQFVRQALRLTAPSGAALLGADAPRPWDAAMLKQMLRLAGKKKDVAAARSLLGDILDDDGLPSGNKRPTPSSNCEWAGVAVMRSDWSPQAAVVAINYSGDEVELELWAEGRQLAAGPWLSDPQADGVALHAAGEWEEVCWFSDDDVDYLELSMRLSSGARLEKQIVLARRDGFLMLVDHLHHGQRAGLAHAWELPLGRGLLFCGEGETRDALIVDGQPVARVLPLALPEWRIDPRGGELASDGQRLRLSQHATGQSIACPVFIDLRSERTTQPSTWRQLTVAESLALQPPDVAVAYRVQCGDKQWVYYRAQSNPGNRSFLGQNTSSECIIARFLPKKGELRELIEIEG